MSPLEASVLERLIDSSGQVEPAVCSCSRLLPQPWLLEIEEKKEVSRAALPLLRAWLAAFKSEAPLPRFIDEIEQGVPFQQLQAVLGAPHTDIILCAGCKRPGVGLRACSRCHAARYCSRECQAGHWPQHKRECRPA